MLSILPCGIYSCVPFSPYHYHWHGWILGFVSTATATQQHTRYISCPFTIFGISSISFPFLRPPPQVQLDFEFALLLLFAGDVSLNPGPGVRDLRLGTVNARSMRLLYLTLLPAGALTSQASLADHERNRRKILLI